MIIFSGELQAFTNEYANLISDDAKDKLGENPLLKVFSVAHEGVAKPRIIGKGVHSLRVIRDAVVSVVNGIKTGIQCFVNHGEDNSHEGRNAVAKVVGKGLKMIEGQLHALAVVHFPDRSNSDFDVISMETPDFDSDNGVLKWFAPVTAFALGRSANGDKPAFTGAVLRGAVQFFNYDEAENKNPKESKMEVDVTKLTKEQIKQAVRIQDISPEEIYKSDRLIGTIGFSEDGKVKLEGNAPASVQKAFESRFKNVTFVQDEAFQKMQERINEFGEIEPKIKEIRRAEKLDAVKKEIETEAKTRGLSDVQQRYLTSEDVINGYDFETDDKQYMDSFIKNQVSSLQKTASLLGVTQAEAGEDNQIDSGSQPNDDDLEGF